MAARIHVRTSTERHAFSPPRWLHPRVVLPTQEMHVPLEKREVERLAALASTDPAAFGAETRQLALNAYEAQDWHGIYEWTKSWITSGGGAWDIDAWLLYVVSALRQGQPRTAVRSVDLALGVWIEAPEDRAILHWVRAAVVHRSLKDPKTALADYAVAKQGTPSWLVRRLDEDVLRCASDARTSRKRKRSVDPAPQLEPRDRSFVAPPSTRREPGAVPAVWPQLLESLTPPASL